MMEYSTEKSSLTPSREEPRSITQYFERPSGDSQQPLADPLRFDPGDSEYRVWCNIRVLNGFLLISFTQSIFAVGIIIASIGHLIYEEAVASGGGNGSRNASRSPGPAKLVFEPNSTFPFLRLLVAMAEVASLFIAFYGVWSQKARYLTPLIGTGIGVIGAIFVYFLLLTLHCVQNEDYYTFCFLGLTLLFLLLVHVLSVHCTVMLRKYFKELDQFVSSARRRWPDTAAIAADKNRAQLSGCVCKRRNGRNEQEKMVAVEGGGTIVYSTCKKCRRMDIWSRIIPRADFWFHHYYISRALLNQAKLERLDAEFDEEMWEGIPCNSRILNETLNNPRPHFNVKNICVPI